MRVTLQWDQASVEVDENAGSVTLQTTATTDRDEALPSDFFFEVTVETADATAEGPVDYLALSDDATIRASDFTRMEVDGRQRYRATRGFAVAVINDSDDESDETFTATLSYVDSDISNLLGGTSIATVTIKDDEHVPVTLGWLNDTVSVNEAAGTVTLDATATTTVNKRPESGFSFQATVATSAGTATAADDYTHVSTTVTFQHSDSWSAVGSGADRRYRAAKRIAVLIINDTDDERDETFTATVEYVDSNPPHLTGGSADVTATIEDNDLPPVSIEAVTATATEEGTLTFRLTRDGITDEPLPVNVRVTETGRMLASGQPTTVTFSANSGTTTLDVVLADDTEDEDNSVVTVTVRSGTGYVPASVSSAMATGQDNDQVPVTLSWDRTAVTVAERAGSVTLRVVATTTKDKQPESGFSFDVTLTTTDGTADSSDYSTGTTSATFQRSDFSRSQGRYRATKDFTINIVSNDGDEADENFTATLAYTADPAPAYLQGSSPVATVTIADNDDPLVTIAADDSSATEADGNITFTFSRGGVAAASLRVNVRVTESGSMLAGGAPTRATFAAGSGTADLAVSLGNDTEDEDDSTVTVEVVNGNGYFPGSDSSASTTVTDDDQVPVTLEWEETAVTVAEGAGSLALTAVVTTTKDKVPESGFTFDAPVTVSDGTATNPEDYEPSSNTTLTFSAGSSFGQVTINGRNRYQATQAFFVTIEGDDDHEQDENFTARLDYANPGEPHLRGGNSTARVTITNDDPVPLVLGWERPEWSVEEDGGSVTLTAVAITSINKQPEDGFSFDASVSTSSGSASRGSDFTGLSITETFLRGDFSRVTFDGQRRYRAEKEFTITIEDDSDDTESNEDFTVSLDFVGSTHYNLTTGVDEATVWIIEDDATTADVRLTRNSSPGRVSPGATLTYEYTVRNDGPATATGLRLVVNLDPYVSVDAADLPTGCSHSGEATGGVVTCSVDNLDDGDDAEITIVVTVETVPSDGIVNRAYVESSVADPTPGNNTFPAATTGGGGGGGVGGGGGGGPIAPPPSALPVFSEGSMATRSVAENAAPDQNVGDPVEAAGSGLTHTLTGADASSFDIVGDSGQLKTKSALDYERKARYLVMVTATNAAEQSASIEVTINVTNVEEAGVVRASSAEPSALAGLFATLSDPDGGITDRVWLWERSADNNVWTTIVGATTNTYTPTEADVGYYLRVSVRYTDAEGSGKRAQWYWTVAVVPEQPPVFSDGSAANRSVNENVSPGANVGRPVRATGYRVAYTLAGEDAPAFEIVPATGQLKTREALDYELKSEYVVTVTATNAAEQSASIAITIRVINLDEPGTATLPAGTPMVAVQMAASLSDPDGGVTDVSWTWQKSADQATWTVIDDAVASNYTPDEGDVGDYLRVTAGYADAQGRGKVAVAETDTAVVASSGEPRFVGPIGDFMVTTEGQDAGSVRLTWTPAEDAQVHFVVSIKAADAVARNYGTARIAPFAGSEGVIAGLEGGEEHLFIAIGMRWNWVEYGTVWGNWTSWVSATPTGEASVVAEPSTASEPSFVGSVTNFAVTTAEQEAGSVRLRWTPAENSQVHFVAHIKSADLAAGNYRAAEMAPFAGSEGVASGLEGGTSYYFIVIGMRWNWVEYGTVWGTWSSWVLATPIASAPKSGQPSPAPEP